MTSDDIILSICERMRVSAWTRPSGVEPASCTVSVWCTIAGQTVTRERTEYLLPISVVGLSTLAQERIKDALVDSARTALTLEVRALVETEGAQAYDAP